MRNWISVILTFVICVSCADTQRLSARSEKPAAPKGYEEYLRAQVKGAILAYEDSRTDLLKVTQEVTDATEKMPDPRGKNAMELQKMTKELRASAGRHAVALSSFLERSSDANVAVLFFQKFSTASEIEKKDFLEHNLDFARDEEELRIYESLVARMLRAMSVLDQRQHPTKASPELSGLTS